MNLPQYMHNPSFHGVLLKQFCMITILIQKWVPPPFDIQISSNISITIIVLANRNEDSTLMYYVQDLECNVMLSIPCLTVTVSSMMHVVIDYSCRFWM